MLCAILFVLIYRIPLKWKLKDGSIKEVNARVGDNLLTIAQANDIDMEGACGGVCAWYVSRPP